MLALAAALPIALVLALMLALQWSAAGAGAAALGLAALLAAWPFGFAADGGAAWAGVAAEGAFTAATILWILLPALALHHLQQTTGALDTVRRAVARLTPEAVPQALLVGWFMALFFEGAAGFGTPLAIVAPLLVGLGFAPVQAVALALLGHAAGVSFGALGTPALTQAALTGLDARDLAWRTALLHAGTGGLLMVFFLRALHSGQPAAHGSAGWGAVAAAAYLLASLGIASWLGPELATLGAAMVGAPLFAWVLRLRSGAPAPAPAAVPGLGRALAPYLVLVALVLATRWPALRELLASVRIEWRWQDRYAGSMQPLLHPGTLLFAALLGGAALQRAGLALLTGALLSAARRLVPVALALAAMLCLSRLMLHAGMVRALEGAAVATLGAHWPWVAPAVGALGSFVTGSATASNVLFTSLQASTAAALSQPVAVVVAGQNFGAALGNVICPFNVVAGAATVGLTGRESEVLRRTALPCAVLLVLAGALLAAWVRLAAR
ncbi:MAG TPA: L-lactate permease [Ramlibacter sp.]|nr:L-lactate permease [Ramlibacter sp.]